MTSFLVRSFLADTDHWDSGEFTFLRGNRTRAGGGSAPSFLKASISLVFSLLKSVVCPGSCNLTLVGEQGQC